jgi:hypothetical protein
MIKKIKEWIWEETRLTGLEGFFALLFVGILELAIMVFLIWILLTVL